jgi:hypothetical protein
MRSEPREERLSEGSGDLELDGEQEIVLPARSSFGLALWVKVVGVLLAPPLAVLFAFGAFEMLGERRASGNWDDLALLALVLTILGSLIVLMLSAPVWVLRTRLDVDPEGLTLRDALRTRKIPWSKIEGYRWTGGRLFVYPAEDRWPMNLSYFANQRLLYAWVYRHLPNLHAAELAREEQEISADHSLGLMQAEKDARLWQLRRITRTINWIAYIAAAIGGVNALSIEHDMVQLVTTSVLVPVPVILVLLALRFRNQVRLDYREGSRYPEGASGILASGLALGLIALLDPHTTLGDRFAQWTFALAAGLGLAWLHLEWERIRAQRRAMLIGLNIAGIVFVSSFWAGGSVYAVNKNADVSTAVWDTTRVTKLYESHDRTGTSYHAEVAPWRASPEPVELDVARATYERLAVGMRVELSVRRGALEIPWVDEVRPKKQDKRGGGA